MDSLREELIAEVDQPRYTDEDRDKAYGMLTFIAHLLTAKGNNVVIDATAHRKKYRVQARELMSSFFEVSVIAPIETCMEREGKRNGGEIMRELYEKAFERKATGKYFPGLGDVIGVDVPYERNNQAELEIDTSEIAPDLSADIILKGLIDSQGDF